MTLFPFELELDVRGYEVDSWGHVNNAVYLNWLEHVRWQCFASAGRDAFVSENVRPVVRYIDLNYLSETRFGDRLRLTFWPRKVGTTSMTFGTSIRIIASYSDTQVGRFALLSTTVLACTGPDGSKAAVPSNWRMWFPETDPGERPEEIIGKG